MMLTRIGRSGLTANRLDPTYYRPEHLRDAQLRGAWTRSTLDELRSPSAPIVYGVLKPDDRGEKFRVAKAERFEGMFVSAEDCDPVSEEMFREFGRAEAIDGDLLVAIGGYVGRPALLRVEDGLRVVVNRHLARVRIDTGRVDSGWVLAYFSSARGERQLTREITGSVQAGINLCDLRLVDVPLPSVEAQRYIGDKVRQAERQRERARRLRALVDRRLDRVLPEYDGRTRVFSRVESAALEARLDCRPYRSHFRALEDSIRKVRHSRLEELATLGSGDPVPSDEFTPVGIPLVRNRDIGPGGFWSTETAVGPAYTKAAGRYSASAGLVLVAMDGEFRAQFALDLELPLHVNQRVAMITATRIRPELLTTWLNRHEGQHQLNRWAVKTTVEHTSLHHIGNVLVPRLDEDEEGALADRLLLARHSDWYARALTLSAQALVERLIDGRLTEAELVATQRALEAGDRSADREILKRLRQSDAPDAKALIADVEALYALLDDSEADNT